ncbi:MAG: Flp pilus assembly complex ATPase component TadA [Candidatus Eremiobacteraeota bacterium]|nr:Flp pilus assembly complex ATPase component TadA [Candidatus Eremiobacteraeota bacterium]MCW5872028.1 Flp pilus assembly complex ATPase component TadA [Candidatus Eremiobacteraeota bacterium]
MSWSASSAGCVRVNPRLLQVDRQLLQTLPGPLLRLHRALPIEVRDGILLLGMEDPADLAIQETVRRLTGWEVRVVQLCPDGGPLPGWEQIVSAPPLPQEGFRLLTSQLEANITGSLIWVRLEQIFANPLRESLGGLYQVPIPHGALLQGLWADQGGSPLPLRSVERVTLAGQLHFSASLAPVGADSQVRLILQYVHILERESAGFRITLPCPLGPEPLASSITLQWPGLLPNHLSCSRPATWVRQQSDQIQIKLQPGEGPSQRPLIFHYRHTQAEKSLQGLLLSDGQHFLLHLQAPPQLQPPPPRHVLFLLDRSASLEGWAAEQGRRAVIHALRQLRPLDRFALAVFDETVEPWQKGRWVGAGAVTAAKEWLQQQARGRTTDLVQALEWIRHAFRDQENLLVVLISDGQGGRQAEVLRLASSLARKLRLFTLSLGDHSQLHFLRRLAEVGGGSSEVALAQDLSSGVERLVQQLGQPILSNMQLVGQGFHCDPAHQYPERLSDIFSAQHLTVLGRHQGIGPLIARGLSEQGPISLTLTPRMVDHPALALLWAQAQREGLLRRLGPAREAERNRLVEQLNLLSRNYSLDPTWEGELFRSDFWRTPIPHSSGANASFQLAEELLEQAAGRQASHIHIELQAAQIKVRLRICGKLQALATPFEDPLALGLLAQFRHWCQLDPSQGQFQSGRFQRDCQKEPYRFEASFCPTVNGEKVVLEVRPARLRSHASLAEPARSAISTLFTRRRGLILVCGPKGSGGNSLMVDWLSTQFADRHAVLCHKEEWFGLKSATQVMPQQDLTSLLQELEGHDIDVLACTAARHRSAWESLLRRAGERSLVLARHHAPQAGAALVELLEQGLDGRTLGKAILGAISLRRVPRLCGCKVPEQDAQVLAALPAEGNYARKQGCTLCHGEGVRGGLLCSEVLLYRSEIFAALKPGVKADRLEQAFIRYPMQQQLLRLAQQGLIEARHCLSPNNIF